MTTPSATTNRRSPPCWRPNEQGPETARALRAHCRFVPSDRSTRDCAGNTTAWRCAPYQGAGDHVAAARRHAQDRRTSCGTPARRDQAEARYAGALVLLDGTDAPIRSRRAHLMQERGRLAFRMGDHEGAVQWADKAIDYAETYSTDLSQEIGLEAARALAEALNTKGCRPRAGSGANVEAVQSDRTWRGSGRGSRLADRGFAAPPPISACSMRWSIRRAPSGSAAAASKVATRIGDLGFQARLYTNLAVACCTFTDRCGEEGVPAARKRPVEIDPRRSTSASTSLCR